MLELRGIPSIDEDGRPTPRRTLVSSRSFGERIEDLEQLRQAVATFSARAGERLRREGLTAGGIAVHIRTSRQHVPFVGDTAQHTFPVPTSDSAAFIRAALAGLEAIYKPNTPYAKAGIMLFDLSSRKGRQFSLLTLGSTAEDKRREALMASLDRINARMGRGAVRWGAQGPEHAPWHMQQEHLSPKVTTDWAELACAHCSDEPKEAEKRSADTKK